MNKKKKRKHSVKSPLCTSCKRLKARKKRLKIREKRLKKRENNLKIDKRRLGILREMLDNHSNLIKEYRKFIEEDSQNDELAEPKPGILVLLDRLK